MKWLYFFLYENNNTYSFVCFNSRNILTDVHVSPCQREKLSGADPRFFFGGGALVSYSTSTPINHKVFFFFLQNTSCIRKPKRVYAALLNVLTQLVLFRFRIHGTLTTDPWPRANPLDAVYKFRRIIAHTTGTNPLYWNWKEQYWSGSPGKG